MNFSVNENGEAEFYVKGVGKKSIYDIISDKTISSRAVIQTDSGSGDWGVVSKAMIRQASPELGLQALPIRLYKGNAGYGLVHIAKHLKDYTFADVSREIENLFGKPNKIYARRDGKAVKLEVFPKPPALWGILELREEQECYSIVSFYPRQNRNSKAKGKLIWEYGSQSVSPQAANELSKNGAVIKPPQTAQEETTAKSDSTIPLLNENVKSEKGERTENIRFSLNQYSDADWRDMVGYMKAKVGTLLTKPDADYRRILEEAGMECFSDADAHVIAAEAMEANRKDEAEAGRRRRDEWIYKNELTLRQVIDFAGSDDFKLVPDQWDGEKFTGTWIAPEYVEYSEKRPQGKTESDRSYKRYLNRREKKLKSAKGYRIDEVAEAIARKTGGDKLTIQEQLVDYFRDLKKPDLYHKYAEFRKQTELSDRDMTICHISFWYADKFKCFLLLQEVRRSVLLHRREFERSLQWRSWSGFFCFFLKICFCLFA